MRLLLVSDFDSFFDVFILAIFFLLPVSLSYNPTFLALALLTALKQDEELRSAMPEIYGYLEARKNLVPRDQELVLLPFNY